MHQYNPTTPQEAVQEYILQNRRKKAILLLAVPPAIMLISYFAVPFIKLFSAFAGNPNPIDDIGYGIIIIYYAGIALGTLTMLAWVPCAIIGVLLLLNSRAKK